MTHSASILSRIRFHRCSVSEKILLGFDEFTITDQRKSSLACLVTKHLNSRHSPNVEHYHHQTSHRTHHLFPSYADPESSQTTSTFHRTIQRAAQNAKPQHLVNILCLRCGYVEKKNESDYFSLKECRTYARVCTIAPPNIPEFDYLLSLRANSLQKHGDG